MRNGGNTLARSWRFAVLASAPGFLGFGSTASAEAVAGVNVSLGAVVESNPYLVQGASTDFAGSIDVAPWVRLSDDISSVDVSGNVSVNQYTKGANGTDITGSINAAGSYRLSEYLSLTGGVNYQTTRNGINSGFAIAGPNQPLPPPTTPLPDVTLGGTRTRSQSMSASLGLSGRLSPLDGIGGSFTVARSLYDSPTGRDFKYINGGLNYSRTLSERIALTASVRYGKSDYLGARIGDGTIITPEAGIDATLSSRITLSVSLGASFSRTRIAPNVKISSTSLSGQGRLCRKEEGGATCIVAARSAQPTALGSIATLTSVAAMYDTRLSARDTVSFSIAYNTGSDVLAPTAGLETSKYYSAGGTWGHNFNRRLSMYVSPGVSRIKNSSESYNTYRVSIGLRYSFGAIS